MTLWFNVTCKEAACPLRAYIQWVEDPLQPIYYVMKKIVSLNYSQLIIIHIPSTGMSCHGSRATSSPGRLVWCSRLQSVWVVAISWSLQWHRLGEWWSWENAGRMMINSWLIIRCWLILQFWREWLMSYIMNQWDNKPSITSRQSTAWIDTYQK